MKTRSQLVAVLCALSASPLMAEAPRAGTELNVAPESASPVLVSFTENNGAAENMITRGNAFSFKAAPVVVTDLGGNLPVRRVSARYKGPAGRFDFYVIEGDQKLSEDRDGSGVRRVSMTSVTTLINGATPDRRVPIASVRVPKTNDFIEVRRFIGPVIGRYVVAIFHADNGRVSRGDGKGIVRASNDGKAIVGGLVPEDGQPGQPGDTPPTLAEFNPGGFNPNLTPPSSGLADPRSVIPVPGDPPSVFVPTPTIIVPPPSGIPPISR